ncbi:MAG: DNA polymerase III subunit gamma/tau [candidate division WOR-3 bacterium]
MESRQVLTLKYRPQTFAELLIQDHVKNTLTKAIEHNRLANAYIFAGPRGVGKTTSARILAKSLNCLAYQKPTTTPCNKCSACVEITNSRSLDVLEIDGASNRGIDQVRELRENIKYAPASLRYKVYIIDEVHMLTKEAFNALLKTLEEPPPHAKFIFATTAPHEVPLTILSRCQRFDFRKATPGEIVQRLQWIAEKENIKISSEALSAIARRADGAIRDAEGLLDLLSTYSPEGIELSHVEELLGIVPTNIFFEYAEMIAAGNPKPMIEFIENLFTSGYDLMEFYAGAVNHFRNLLWAKLGITSPDSALLPEEVARLNNQAQRFTSKQLMKIVDLLSRNEEKAKNSLLPKILLEIITLELMELEPNNHSQEPVSPHDKVTNPPLPDPPPAKNDEEASAIWSKTLKKIHTYRSSLAKVLNFLTPISWKDNTLTIAFAPEHKGNIHHFESHREKIERFLSEVTGITARIEVVVHPTIPQVDNINTKVREIFGEVEEK